MKQKKKVLIYAVTLILLIMVLICAIKLPMLINDLALSKYETQVLQDLKLPEGVTVVEYISACCNSSGTGDHTDLYVAVLVKSEVDKEVLVKAAEKLYGFVYDVKTRGDKTLAMKIADIEFGEKIENTDNCFIMEFSKRAPLLDLRGT